MPLDPDPPLSKTAPPETAPSADPAPPQPDLNIGIAQDAAFGFYYADDLAAFADHGARLVPFDTLNDRALPAVDGLYIGGGFPEIHAEALSANRAMRAAVKGFVAAGGPVYAECGGLMYLAQTLTLTPADGGDTWDMAGALPASVEMTRRPVGRGYVVLRETGDGLWPPPANQNQPPGNQNQSPGNHDQPQPQPPADLPAHEFH